MEKDNIWPPMGFDAHLPADCQGIHDPANEVEQISLDDDLDEDNLFINDDT